MKKRSSSKVPVIVALVLAFVTVFGAAAYAWFASMIHQINIDQTSGKVLTQYFHCGIGTKDEPFVITRPIHYYNLVNLYQKVPTYSDQHFYFQLGYDKFSGHSGEYLVYKYGDDGEPETDASGNYLYDTTLNLSSYDEDNPLLPIGTSDKNFLGVFNGNNLTIAGFTVDGDDITTEDSTEKQCDIGIFGYIGAGLDVNKNGVLEENERAAVKNVYFKDVTISLTNATGNVATNSSASQTHNASAHVTDDGSKTAYVGYIAGHVVNTSQCSHVYLNNVTITGGGGAISNFGYFGLIENEDGTYVETLGETIATQFGSSSDVGWGSTVDMKLMFNRLYSIAKVADRTGNPVYPTAETLIYEKNADGSQGRLISRFVTETGTDIKSHSGYGLELHAWSSTLGGSYAFNTYNGYNPWIYLTGINEYQTKTVTTYLTWESDDPAYYITDTNGKNYLSVNSSMNVVNEKSKDKASKWVEDSAHHLYTFVGVTKYYLNASGNGFVLETTAKTVWNIGNDANGKRQIYTTVNSVKYYMTFDSVWKLIEMVQKYAITDGNGNYLGMVDGYLDNKTNAGSAISWEITTSGSNVQFKTKDTGTVKYLAFQKGVGLTLSATAFSWTKGTGSNDLYPYSYKDTTTNTIWYLAFDDGWKVVENTGKNISCTVNSTTYYLTADKGFESVISGDQNSYLSLWQMETGTSSTTISVNYNGKTYYLVGDTSTGLASLSETPQTWYKGDNNKYYIKSASGDNYYLVYDNGWKVKTTQRYYLTYNDGTKDHFITFENGAVVDKTTATDNGAWTVENISGSGYITIDIEGTVYYLTSRADGTLVVQTNKYEISEEATIIVPPASVWSKNSIGFTTEINNYSRILIFDTTNSKWKTEEIKLEITSVLQGCDCWLRYVEDDNGDYYVINKTWSESDTRWQFDNDSIWCVDGNGQKWYLTFAGENLTPTMSKTESNEWDVSDSGIRTKDGKYTLNVYFDGTTGNSTRLWITHSSADYVLFRSQTSDGSGYYFSFDSNLKGTGNWFGSSYWTHFYFDSQKHVYICYKGSTYYLKKDGTKFVFVTDKSQATVFITDNDIYPGGVYFINNDNTRRYITAQSGKGGAHDYLFGYQFTANTYYLIGDVQANTISSATSSTISSNYDNSFWQMSSPDGSKTYIYRESYGVAYYLKYSGGALSFTKTKDTGTLWNKDSYGFYIESGKYLSCLGGTWGCYYNEDKNKYQIGSNTLSINDSGAIGNNSTHQGWTLLSGSLYARNNSGTAYYLTINNGTLQTTTSKPSITWSFDSTYKALSATVGGVKYYVTYDSGWKVTQLTYYIYASGTSYYLPGYKSDYDNTSNHKYKLVDRANAGKWTINDGVFVSTEGAYFGVYFRISSISTSMGISMVVYPDIYIGAKKSQILDGTTKVLSSYYVKTSADLYQYKWQDYPTSGNNKRFYMQFPTNKFEVKISSSWSSVTISETYRNGGALLDGSSIKNSTSSGSLTTFVAECSVGQMTVSKVSDKVNPATRNFKMYYEDDATNIAYYTRIKNTASANAVPKISPSSGYAKTSPAVKALTSVAITEATHTPLPAEKLVALSMETNIKTIDTKAQAFSDPTVLTNQKSGAVNYIPLRLELQDEDDKDSYFSDYRVDSRNTGYIVSGSYQTSGGYRSDIRVSNYDTGDIYRSLNSGGSPTYTTSYDARLQVITKTYKTNGAFVRIKDSRNKNTTSYNSSLPSTQKTWKELGLTKYEDDDPEVNAKLSRTGFAEMLLGDNDVFGLHFMESTITKDHIIYADQVTILGNTYYNYELPEDAIDFKVKDRGAINFFAGTYYSSDVNSFFSLHEIFRDQYQHITAIKEISKVYKVNGITPYIYKYTDGTYSRDNITDAIINDTSKTTMLFNTAWIGKQSGLIQNAVYYFEIPVNKGEYALGSVKDGIGAYLLYLDIATNGTSITEDKISPEGNGLSNNFKVDYRTAPDVLNYTSLIQFSVTAPEGATAETFSVSVSFDRGDGKDSYCPSGLYTIEIVNKTGQDVYLTVFVCDNDIIATNDYPYAYQIKYANSGQSTLKTLEMDDQTKFKSCYEFVVPSNGNPY